jgi:hypothetical protein
MPSVRPSSDQPTTHSKQRRARFVDCPLLIRAWEELRQNVKEAAKGFYFDRPNEGPSTLRLHLVRDEVLAYA